VADGNDLVRDLADGVTGSRWVIGSPEANAGEAPKTTGNPPPQLAGGLNGVAGAPYDKGLDALLTVDAHLIVAAGQDDAQAGAMLAAHCDKASSDLLKRDRIAVVGSGFHPTGLFDALIGHSLDSDRLVFVGPGIETLDAASVKADRRVMLPGAYAAAAVAGKLASLSPHVSLTNKPLPVSNLEAVFDPAQLAQLVKARVLGLEKRQGFRVVKGITTTTGGAFAQITIRRIVDYAKYGVRSAATPYIGLLNNTRVRAAMQATINSFLDTMVKDEMLTEYKLAVTATRDEEKQGVARVTMTLQPTFSIDYIKVTMFLE